MSELTPRQSLFVAEFLKHGNATHAALPICKSPNSARNTGYEMLKVPAVQAAIAAARKELSVKGVHNLEIAMAEAQKAMDFAERTDNANAYVSAVVHRAKMNGLIDQKVDIRLQGFNLNIVGYAPAEEVAAAISQAVTPKPTDDEPEDEVTEDDLLR